MEQKSTDGQFYKTASILSLIIFVILIVIVYLSNVFANHSKSHTKNHGKELSQLIDDRTMPIGRVNLASNPSIKPKIEVAVSNQTKSGEQVYNAVCLACHSSGAAGAPITGNKNQWSERIAEGIDHLYEQAINGIGVMPAKGGNPSLTDDEVKAAVDYMIEKSN
ncbi:MAG: c-type cytochrome [Pseudomonadota bacterium]|nr:c-type cytochrome [Pseudomonadota bacterium]